jgi:hypothetical protein
MKAKLEETIRVDIQEDLLAVSKTKAPFQETETPVQEAANLSTKSGKKKIVKKQGTTKPAANNKEKTVVKKQGTTNPAANSENKRLVIRKQETRKPTTNSRRQTTDP